MNEPYPYGMPVATPRGHDTLRPVRAHATHARVIQNSMARELNWCGQPIGAGEGYGGRPENIPKTWSQPPEAKQHYCVVTESNLAEVFGNGAYKLTKAEAAKRLELLTGAHRTSCYRALRLNGRFSRHLRAEGTMLSWR